MISKIDINPDASTLHFDTNLPFNDYKGAINVHSTIGEGQGTVPEILQAGYLAKLNFIIFTESNVYSKKIEPPSYKGDLLILHGREYSYLKSRLILIGNNINFEKINNAASAQLYISDTLEKPNDAFVILNHPTKPGYEWEGDYSTNLDALEIINLRSNWSAAWNKSKLNFIRSLLIYPFNADYAFLNLFQQPIKNLKIWNKLNQDHRTVGILGSDAKSKLRIYDKTYLKFPSYKKLFSLGLNHVLIRSELTGNTKSDSAKVLNAIKSGAMYFSLDFAGNPNGFQYYAKNNNSLYPMGSRLPSKGTELCVRFPNANKKVRARVFLDGAKFLDLKENKCFKADQEGSYNVILHKTLRRAWPFESFNIPWVISNFIYIEK